MATARASKAARAVNSLLAFSSGDQEALLDVIQDYFPLPDGTADDELDELDDLDEDSENTLDDGVQAMLEGTE